MGSGGFGGFEDLEVWGFGRFGFEKPWIMITKNGEWAKDNNGPGSAVAEGLVQGTVQGSG